MDFMAEAINYIQLILPSLLKGAGVTVEVFLLTLCFSIPLGLPFALGSESRILPLRWFCRAYVWLFRGTPLLLQLFFFYFMLPILFGIKMSALTTAIITFVLNYAAYFSEIYRGGIGSIDRGQYEAAACLGISPMQTMFDIILPQTVKRILPSVANETITLVKDTSLVYAIGVSELMKMSKAAVNRDSNVLSYLVAAIIYLLMTFVLTKLSDYLERRFSRHEVRSE
jgi:polar amino acid transport system permease protein